MKFHIFLPWVMLCFLVFVVQPLVKSKKDADGGVGADRKGVIRLKAGGNDWSWLILLKPAESAQAGLKVEQGDVFSPDEPDNQALLSGFKTGGNLAGDSRKAQRSYKTAVEAKTAVSQPRQAEHLAWGLPGWAYE